MFCRLFRFMISSAADSGDPLGPATERHVARCEDCRQFLASCRRLGAGLRAEASQWERDLGGSSRGPAFPGKGHRPNLRPGLPIRAALAVAAAVIAFAAVALPFVTVRRPADSPPTTIAVALPADTQWTAKWVEALQTPLTTEAENLRSDARSGIRFLAACLDVRPLGVELPAGPGDTGPSSLP